MVIKPGRDRERNIQNLCKSRHILRAAVPCGEHGAENAAFLFDLTDKCYSNDNAKKEITRLGLADFGFPKPSALIERLVGMTQAGQCLIFLQAPGTTAQAVLELNRQGRGAAGGLFCAQTMKTDMQGYNLSARAHGDNRQRADGSVYSQGTLAKVRYFTVFSKRRNKGD